jgi:pantoate--beta-alanine ligase
VCQVVKRLFELVRPAAAMFGEKDWQQLQVIRAMTAEQRLEVEIVPVATMREPDGLAMSSRNVFLTREDRVKARSLSAALCAACGERTASAAEATMARVLGDAGAATEYAVVRDPATLMPLAPGARAGRALIAARVGSVRLIDNAEWRAAG